MIHGVPEPQPRLLEGGPASSGRRDADRARGGGFDHHDLRRGQPPLFDLHHSGPQDPGRCGTGGGVAPDRPAKRHCLDGRLPGDLHLDLDPGHLHQRDAGGEFLPREPPSRRHGGGDRGRTIAATPAEMRFDPRGSTTTGAGNVIVSYPAGTSRRVEVNPPGRVRSCDGTAACPSRRCGATRASPSWSSWWRSCSSPLLSWGWPQPSRRAGWRSRQGTRRRRRRSWLARCWRTCATAPTTWTRTSSSTAPRFRRRPRTAASRAIRTTGGRSPLSTTRPEIGTKTVTVAVIYRNSSGVEQPVTLTMIFTQGT